MVVALEPITAVNSDDVVYHESDRNLYCRKGDLGAQWEYTVLFTEHGSKILAGDVEDLCQSQEETQDKITIAG